MLLLFWWLGFGTSMRKPGQVITKQALKYLQLSRKRRDQHLALEGSCEHVHSSKSGHYPREVSLIGVDI